MNRTDPKQVVFVGNVPWSASEGDLLALIRQLGFAPMRFRLALGPDGRSRGFGFADLPSADDATACIAALDGVELQGRRLTANASRSSQPSSNRQLGGAPHTRGGYRGLSGDE